jgi:diguanylate cyclase (GGDEF)-like protein
MKLGMGAESNSIYNLAAAVGQAQAPLKLLVAEDNPVFQSMLRSMLTRWGYDVIMAHDGLEAWELLESRNPPRLAVLDWMMPGIDGVEICRRLRAAPREPYIYVVLLTARTGASDLVDGMDAGADDYLTKPIKSHELRVRLRAGRRILELQEQLLKAGEALRVRATYDELTGLLNRRCILEALDSETARSSRESQPLSALMMDLDFFKAINDTRGHQAGDAVLREAADRMKACIRRYDSVGRYGGEEFLFVLPGCDLEGAITEAERIRKAIGITPFPVFGDPVSVTCCIGVACRGPKASWDTGAFLRQADRGLYMAKSQGRNRVVAASLEGGAGDSHALITRPS